MRTSLLALLLVGVAALCVTAAHGQEWQPIKNITDSHVQGIGKCAVDEQNKVTNCALRFVKVVGGEVQTGGGVPTYLLDVDALRLDSSHKVYKVKVLEEKSPTNSPCRVVSFGPGC